MCFFNYSILGTFCILSDLKLNTNQNSDFLQNSERIVEIPVFETLEFTKIGST